IQFYAGEILDPIAAGEHERSAGCRHSRTSSTWRQSTAEVFNRSITGARGSQSLTISPRRPSVRSPLSFSIRTSSTRAVAKDYIGRIFQLAMGFINRLTPERLGRISDCAKVSRSRSWLSIQRIQIEFLSP